MKKRASSAATTSLDSLPNETLLDILGNYCHPLDWLQFAMINKKCCRIGRSEELWFEFKKWLEQIQGEDWPGKEVKEKLKMERLGKGLPLWRKVCRFAAAQENHYR